MMRWLKSKGSALLSVFLLLATMTVLVTEMIERQFLDIRRTTHMLAQDQASVYAQAAEQVAIRLLLDDYKEEIEDQEAGGVIIDHLKDKWHQKSIFPVDGGAIAIQLTDLQSRFNLNDLKEDRWEARLRFKRLMTNLELDGEHDLDELIKSLIEWMDKDDETQFGGAEDLHYLGQEPPYRTANSLMKSLEELRMVKGFTREVVNTLLPHVALYPEATPANINTADVELLTTYSNIGDIGKLVEERGDEGYASVGEAVKASGGNKGKNIDQTAFTIQSQFFLLEARAVINDRTAYLRSVIYRPLVLDKKSTIKVISRNQARRFG